MIERSRSPQFAKAPEAQHRDLFPLIHNFDGEQKIGTDYSTRGNKDGVFISPVATAPPNAHTRSTVNPTPLVRLACNRLGRTTTD